MPWPIRKHKFDQGPPLSRWSRANIGLGRWQIYLFPVQIMYHLIKFMWQQKIAFNTSGVCYWAKCNFQIWWTKHGGSTGCHHCTSSATTIWKSILSFRLHIFKLWVLSLKCSKGETIYFTRFSWAPPPTRVLEMTFLWKWMWICDFKWDFPCSMQIYI